MTVSNLPGERDGRVLSRYVGGRGRGKHYYRGMQTKFPYKVTYGDLVYADPADVRADDNKMNPSLLVKVVVAKAEPEPAVQVPVAKKEVELPKEKRAPRVMENSREALVDIPDIVNMTVKQILGLELTADLAHKLLDIEKNGRNRAKVIAFLESRTGDAE